MNFLSELIHYVLATVIRFFPILLLGAALAAFIQIFVDPERMRDWLTRRSAISVPATVAFGAFTPFCACGTMAVIVGMLATTMPWAPIMAFLTSSPLMSPTNFVLLYGVVSPGFATAAAGASILVGLTAGYVTLIIERRSSFLTDQLRFADGLSRQNPPSSCDDKRTAEASSIHSESVEETLGSCCQAGTCAQVSANTLDSCHCTSDHKPASCCAAPGKDINAGGNSFASHPIVSAPVILKITAMVKTMLHISLIRILPIFTIFTAVGFLMNQLVPASIFTRLLGSQSLIGVPLATLIGLPLYVSGESAVPLIRSLLDAGVSPGAMLAFMIAGPGTSAAAIAGIATIMKRRAIALYVGYILGAALLFGYGYDAVLRVIF